MFNIISSRSNSRASAIGRNMLTIIANTHWILTSKEWKRNVRNVVAMPDERMKQKKLNSQSDKIWIESFQMIRSELCQCEWLRIKCCSLSSHLLRSCLCEENGVNFRFFPLLFIFSLSSSHQKQQMSLHFHFPSRFMWREHKFYSSFVFFNG